MQQSTAPTKIQPGHGVSLGTVVVHAKNWEPQQRAALVKVQIKSVYLSTLAPEIHSNMLEREGEEGVEVVVIEATLSKEKKKKSTAGFPVDCSSRLLQYSGCRCPILIPRPDLESPWKTADS